MDEQSATESVDDEYVDDAGAAPWPSARPLDASKMLRDVTPAPSKKAGLSDTARDISKRGDALLFPEHAMGHQERVDLLEAMLARSDAPTKINLRIVGSYVAAIDREFDLVGTTGAVMQQVMASLEAQKKVLPTTQWGTWVNAIGRANKDRMEPLLRSLKGHVVFLYGKRYYRPRTKGAPARLIYEWLSDAENPNHHDSALLKRVLNALMRAAEKPNAFRPESDKRREEEAAELAANGGVKPPRKRTANDIRQIDEEFALIKPWRPMPHKHPQAAAVRTVLQLMLSLLQDPQPQRRFILIKWARLAAADVGFVGDPESGRTELAILLGLLRDLVKNRHAKAFIDEGIVFSGVPEPEADQIALVQQLKTEQQHRKLLEERRKARDERNAARSEQQHGKLMEERKRAREERNAARAAGELVDRRWPRATQLASKADQAGKVAVFTYVSDGVEAFDARNGAVRGIRKGTFSGAKSKAQALRGKSRELSASAQPPAQGLLHPAPAPVEVVPRRIPRAVIEATQSRAPDGHLVTSAQAQPAAEPNHQVMSDAAPTGAAEDRIASQVSEHRARRLRQLASRRATLQVVPIIKAPEADGGLGLLDLINASAGKGGRGG